MPIIIYEVYEYIEYEPGISYGIFSTKEKAELVQAKHPNSQIEERELDEEI